MQEDTEKAESLESTSEVAKPAVKRKRGRPKRKTTSLKVTSKVEKITPVVKPKSLQEQLVGELIAEYPSLKFKYKDGSKYFYEYNKSGMLIEGEHDKEKLIWSIGRVEKYYEVRFTQRTDKNETKDVQLSVNGDLLLFARDKPTIAPWRYLHAADNAVYPLYIQDDKHNRKITGWVKFYPYQIVKHPYDLKTNPDGVTEAQFFKLKEEGNEKQRLAKERREKVEE